MDRRGAIDPFAELREASKEYKVYDSHYERIGKVDDLIVDQADQVAYVGVKMGFFGTNSTLIPIEIVRINDKRRLIEVSEPAETIKHAPHFGSIEELTPELENHVRTYFGLEGLRPSPEHELRGSHPAVTEEQVDVVPGERAASQESSIPASEGAPEARSVESQPERTSSEEFSRERPGEEPEDSPGGTTTEGGTTTHRLRR